MTQTTPSAGALYTIAETAERFQVCTATVLNWIKRGDLAATRPGGGHWRITAAAIERASERRNRQPRRAGAMS